jgi:hypothetical protein
MKSAAFKAAGASARAARLALGLVLGLALGLALASPAQAAQRDGESPAPVISQNARPESAQAASWRVDPREREVGEEFEAVLVIPHAANERVELDAAALEVDPAWIVAAAPRSSPERNSSGAIVGTRFTWSLACFEPGERDLPQPKLTRVDASGGRSPLQAPPQIARFVGLLALGEDEARPALGFRPLAPLAEANSVLPWAAGGVALLLAGLGAWVLRRGRRTPQAATPTALGRLAELEARQVETRAAAREVYYELTALVRAEFDARSGGSRAALTDREWLASVAAKTAGDGLRELEALFAEAEPVKYAAQHPTHWAVRESLARARRVLEALGDAPRRAA